MNFTDYNILSLINNSNNFYNAEVTIHQNKKLSRVVDKLKALHGDKFIVY